MDRNGREGFMTGIIVAVGLVAAGVFGLGLLVGMAVGFLILRRADGLGERQDKMSRMARRLTGAGLGESAGR